MNTKCHFCQHLNCIATVNAPAKNNVEDQQEMRPDTWLNVIFLHFCSYVLIVTHNGFIAE